MSIRILVAYASPKGSTAEIAQAVGKELQSAGFEVEVKEMKSVVSVDGYQAVVIGGPFYLGKVVGDVGKFKGKYLDNLAKVPFAAFGVGVAPVGKNSQDIDNAMKKLQKTLEPLKPVALTIFAGKIDLEKLSIIQKWMVGKVKAPVGDFREWSVIAAWAQELPGKMRIGEVRPGT
jgi:menaquinone-dependent protoporphyrinogen oxidase